MRSQTKVLIDTRGTPRGREAMGEARYVGATLEKAGPVFTEPQSVCLSRC